MWWRCTLALLLISVPAHGRDARLRVALAPVKLVNTEPSEGRRLKRLLLEELNAAHGLEVATVLDSDATCELRQAGCLGRLRRELDSHRLALLRVGQLGGTSVLRLTVYDLERQARQGSWQEVLQRAAGQDAERLALRRMVAGFSPAPAEPPAWYARWWVWTAAGVAVAGGVTAVVLLSRGGDVGPDGTIVPPKPNR